MSQTIVDARKRLISAVHVAKNSLGLDEETYRSLLTTVTGKSSAAKMSYQELNQVLDAMKQRGFSYRKPAKRRMSPKSKGSEIDKIRAIWITMHQHGFVNDGSEAALDAYVKRMTGKINKGPGIEHVGWLKDEAIERVLEALKGWHKREMVKGLLAHGINSLQGHRKAWTTHNAPYDYVAAAFNEVCR